MARRQDGDEPWIVRAIANVRWELVRYMLTLMDHEFAQCLDTAQFIKCSTYLDSLKIMFAEDVFASEVTPSYNGVA